MLKKFSKCESIVATAHFSQRSPKAMSNSGHWKKWHVVNNTINKNKSSVPWLQLLPDHTTLGH